MTDPSWSEVLIDKICRSKMPSNLTTWRISLHRLRPRHSALKPSKGLPPPQAILEDKLKTVRSMISFCNGVAAKIGRVTSPASLQFWSKVKRGCAEVLNPTRRLKKKAWKSEIADNDHIQMNGNHAYARYRRLHGKDQLLDQLCDCVQAMMEYRLMQDYGDYYYLAKEEEDEEDRADHLPSLPAVARKEQLEELLLSMEKIPWTEVAERLAKDHEAVLVARRRNRSRPGAPWITDAACAARTIGGGLTRAQVVWEVHEYARRRDGTCPTNNALNRWLKEQDWIELAYMILRDLLSLNVMYGSHETSSDEEEHMRAAIERLRDWYFDGCYQNEENAAIIIPRVEAWPGLHDGVCRWKGGRSSREDSGASVT